MRYLVENVLLGNGNDSSLRSLSEKKIVGEALVTMKVLNIIKS